MYILINENYTDATLYLYIQAISIINSLIRRFKVSCKYFLFSSLALSIEINLRMEKIKKLHTLRRVFSTQTNLDYSGGKVQSMGANLV